MLFFRLSEFGERVGIRMVELLFVREKNYKRETKLLNILLFVKGILWKVRNKFFTAVYIIFPCLIASYYLS